MNTMNIAIKVIPQEIKPYYRSVSRLPYLELIYSFKLDEQLC